MYNETKNVPNLFFFCPFSPHLLHPLLHWHGVFLGTVYVPIILSVTSVCVAGLLAPTAFILSHSPGVSPADRWWGRQWARRSDLLDSRCLCCGARCRCRLREQLPLSCRLPPDHCLSCCTLGQVVLKMGSRVWGCSCGAHLYRWERSRSNRNSGRQVYPLKKNTAVLPLQSPVVPLHQRCLIYVKQLQSSALHDSGITQDQLPDLPVVSDNQSPSCQSVTALFFGALVNVTQLDTDGLYKTTAAWPLGGGPRRRQKATRHALHTWSKFSSLF